MDLTEQKRIAARAVFPPQGYIVGAQKAATTSLVALLKQHPAIIVSEPKEPDYFSTNRAKGLDWYRGCFARLDGFLVDASTSYAAVPVAVATGAPRQAMGDVDHVARILHAARPDAKFVYMLRDPAERAYSAYCHEVRAGREPLPLREALIRFPYYLYPSCYHSQIAQYLDYFDPGQFLFVRFDEFVADPAAVARRCCRFFGVAPDDFAFRPQPALNESFQHNRLGAMAYRFLGKDAMERLSIGIRAVTPAWGHAALKRILSKRVPPLSQADYDWISSLFAREVADFAKLTGIDLWDKRR